MNLDMYLQPKTASERMFDDCVQQIAASDSMAAIRREMNERITALAMGDDSAFKSAWEKLIDDVKACAMKMAFPPAELELERINRELLESFAFSERMYCAQRFN
jgi:hypothetical protein